MRLVDVFKKVAKQDKKTTQKTQEAILQVDKSKFEMVANKTYPGLQMFARDVNLSPELAVLYKTGMIICERGFTDATIRFMGMPATHRYVILSNHMVNMSIMEQGTNWGLHIANAGSHFKVLGQTVCNGKTGIFLLHLPDDEDWKLWKTAEFSMDDQVFQMAVQRFNSKCNAEIIPELAGHSWLDRCSMPLGMDENGHLFEL